MNRGNQPWYDRAFGEDYLVRYAHRDQAEAARAVALFLRQLQGSGTILDLCCGGGRHLRELLRQRPKIDVVGVDRSAALLAAAAPLGVRLVRGDMGRLPFRSRTMAGVASFFTSFGYFHSDAENAAVLREIGRVLQPGGVYFFDFLNAVLLREELHWLEQCRTLRIADPRDHRRLSTDGQRVEKTIFTAGGHVEESVRLYDLLEITEMAKSANLERQTTFGDYGGGAFDESTSGRLIIIFRRL